MIMGIKEKKHKYKFDALYILAGISADVAQLTRAFMRNERRGVRRNIKQINKKLDNLIKVI